jgi:hypothetical protein
MLEQHMAVACAFYPLRILRFLILGEWGRNSLAEQDHRNGKAITPSSQRGPEADLTSLAVGEHSIV